MAFRSHRIARFHVVTHRDFDALAFHEAFPTLSIGRVAGGEPGDAIIDGALWNAADSFESFAALDRAIEEAPGDGVVVHGSPSTAFEVATRNQRFFWRRNRFSETGAFDAILAAHRELHDLDKPLVRADYDHALDTWQWVLRLEPNASLELQLAALFHDIERLESEADARVEHRVPDYQKFKDAHAERGGERAHSVLRMCGVDERSADRVRAMVARHERRRIDREVCLVNDADGLSFFSLNSPGYVAYFGATQTRRKVAYTLARLGRRALRELERVRLCPTIARFVAEVAP